MKKSLILIPFAALVLAGCSYQPVRPTSESTAPTSEPTTQPGPGPTSETTTQPGPGPTTSTTVPPTPGQHDGLTPETAFTGLEAAAKCQEIGSTYSTEKYYVKDTVFSKDSGFDTTYGTHSFHLGSDSGLYCFRLKNGANHDKFTADTDIEVGDTVMVYGQMVLYQGETPEMTYSYNSGIEGYVYSIQKPGTDVKVTSVAVSPTSASIAVGGTQQLSVTVLPSDATVKDVTYESNATSIATVSSSGLVTGVTEGYATITVKSTDGSNKSATCAITVGNPTPPAEETISKTITELATQYGWATDGTVRYSEWNFADGITSKEVSTGSGTFESNCGKVYTYNSENNWRLYSANNPTWTLDAGTKSIKSVTITYENADTQGTKDVALVVGGTQYLSGVEIPVAASKVDITLAKLSASNGQARIKAISMVVTGGTPSVPVTSVSVSPTSATLAPGGSQQLTPTVLPEDATNKNVTYESSATGVATVSSTGLISAVALGSAVITVKSVSDPTKTATCNVTVQNIAVTGVSLDKTTATVNVGESFTLVPTVLPADATNKNVSWSSSDTSKAKVLDGVVSGMDGGEVTITVTTQDGGYQAQCVVTVVGSKVPVTGVTVNPTTMSLVVGQSEAITSTIEPSNATDKSCVWSSSAQSVADVMIVQGEGPKVVAYGVGNAVITITTYDGGYTANCIVTVSPVAVTGVTLDKSTASVNVGGTATLVATVAPSNATNKNVTWTSSNPSVATVANGVVTGVAEGSSIVTVTTEDGGKTATCTVTVSAAPAEQTISINMEAIATANSWVDNTEYSSWSDQGLSFNVTHRDPTGTETESSVYGAKWSSGSKQWRLYQAMTSSLVITPDSGTIKSVKVTYAIGNTGVLAYGGSQYASDAVITVEASPSGAFTVENTGSATNGQVRITAFEIVVGGAGPVTPVAVTGVSLNASTGEVGVGKTLALTATIAPSNATNKAVTWTSSDPSKATVSNGTVTGVAEGTAFITVETVDGGYTATCTVTVTAATAGTTYEFTSQSDLKGWTCTTNPGGYEADRGIQWSNGGTPGTMTIAAPHAVTTITIDVSSNGTGGAISCDGSSYTITKSNHQSAVLTVNIASGSTITLTVTGSSKSIYIKSITLA